MLRLGATLADPAVAGLYRLPDRLPRRTLLRRVAASELRFASIAGAEIVDKAGFLRACATAFAFPPYFGRNWDALADCLMDLSWLPPTGHAILYDHPAPLIRRSPDDWAMARDIFADAARRWSAAGTPFVVLLRRTDGLLPDIPLLGI